MPQARDLDEALSRAIGTLKSTTWSSVGVAFSTFIAVTVAYGTISLVLAQVISVQTLAWCYIPISVLSSVGVFLVLEIRTLYDRSDALRELVDRQREYESLLLDVGRERDRLNTDNVGLSNENSTLRTLLGLSIMAREWKGEPRQ